MANPLSKSKIVAHLADKTGTTKKMASSFFDELFKLAVKETKGAGKFVIPGIRARGQGSPESAHGPQSGDR